MSLDWIALGALFLSVISLGWQVTDRIRSRPKLVVTMTTGNTSEEREGEFWQAGFVTVTTHALNGRIGIRAIDFELDPKPSGYSTHPFQPPGWQSPAIDLHGSHPALENGDTASWSFRFQDRDGKPFLHRLAVTAVVQLVNGKAVRSEPIALTPDFAASEFEAIFEMLQANKTPDGAIVATEEIKAAMRRVFESRPRRDDPAG